MRSNAGNQWLFIKYDALNRPVMTGLTTGLRAALQTAAANPANIRF